MHVLPAQKRILPHHKGLSTAPGVCGYEIMSLGTRKHQTVPCVLQIQMCDDYLMITNRIPAAFMLLIVPWEEVAVMCS